MSDSPHQAAWSEARALLAQAERAAATREDAQLGAAVAHTENAIALLERLLAAAPNVAPRRLLAAAWSLRGRVLQALGTPASLDDAVRSLDAAIARLENPPGETDPQVRCDLAIALQTGGNLRQQRSGDGDLAAAVALYDRAIDLLRALTLDGNPALRQLLGAVWLNRGATWVRSNDARAADEALRSFDEAIAIWRALPGDMPPAQQINLAAAYMNRAHAVLRRHAATDGAKLARDAAAEALALVRTHEREHPGAAEIGLKCRHITCRALGTALAERNPGSSATREELFAAATDTVDEGLALARHWAKRGSQVPLAFVLDLFRFGAQTYLSRQPHFLAEFVLEHLDPHTTEDALPWHPELHAIATEAVALALRELERPRLQTTDAPDTDRRIQSLHDLRATAARLAEMQQTATLLASPPPGDNIPDHPKESS